MEITQILTLAVKEFRDRLRNRWVLAVALVFTVFSLVITYFGGAQQGQLGLRSIEFTITSLVSLVIYLIPLIARLLGFDLCPRLKELKQRHLYVPRGTIIPPEIAAVCEATVDTALIEKHWDTLVHLAASVMSGNASAVAALARFGSAARGDPIYEAGVQLGRLLRTAFLADYFVKDAFRNELRRVLNRGEAVNALKRAIYTGRVSPAQAKRAEEMQAVADALSLLANIIMAWNTTQMQAVLDRWANRRQVIPAELTGKIAPTRLQGINLRGVFRFPVERYASEILPSQTTPKTGTGG